MAATIRPAVRADAELIFSFIRELAEYERLLHEVEADADAIEKALFGAEPRVFCDIADWAGEPAGFALWYYTFSTFQGRHGIYLEDLFVRPAHRGRGLGKALLERLAARTRHEGLGRLEWSVLDWNEPSIAFYEALGARSMDDWITQRFDGDALRALAAGG